jgi:hypothetical protein
MKSQKAGKSFIMRGTDKDDEVGRACSMHGGDEKCVQSFG